MIQIVIFLESLRKYPPKPFLDRKCTADYEVPNTNFIIKEGTPVYISTLGIQTDPNHFPNPGKYDPYRFIRDVNAKKLILTFGLGPRICSGKTKKVLFL